ncbi:MAG TPA: hypothetical protein VII51_12635 [Gaiellaceae bacterium]
MASEPDGEARTGGRNPLSRSLDVAERALAAGRTDNALAVVARVLDALEDRAQAARRPRRR